MSNRNRRPRRTHPRGAGLPRPLLAVLPVVVLAGVLLLIDVTGERAPSNRTAATAVTPAPVATALDVELASRFAAAQQAASADGVELTITSGWRSEGEQQRLVDEALARYGDPTEAHRWVLPPRTSAHVLGLAIDVGDTAGAFWLTEHGEAFGLCRRYQNEVWHFEKLPDGAARCPQLEADSSGGW